MKMFRFKKVMIICITLFISIAEAKVDLSSRANDSVIWTVPEKKLPLPSCASQEIQNTLSSIIPPDIERSGQPIVKTKQEWKDWISYGKLSGEHGTQELAKNYNVSIVNKMVGGVNTYYLTPKSLEVKDTKQLFVYLHGGGYVFGGGMSALTEAILIAKRSQIPVLAVDFRMAPDHPYPTAIEDVVQVYKSLITSNAPKSIAMGGSSSGGGLTLATVQKLKSLNLPLPGALFVGTPWADLTKTGDSFYVNEGIDRKLPTYNGFLVAAANLYANGRDLKDPGLSPVYGDFSGFPPTMLVTGTRDLFLSLTVRVHRKLRSAGVIADLNVYEGLSHVEYFVVKDAPESIETYSELKKFLKQYLK